MGADVSTVENDGVPNIPDNASTSVSFLINGKSYIVDPSCDKTVGPHSRLIDFIRDRAGLTGTKWMCREGGCGACVVSCKKVQANAAIDGGGNVVVRSVNSCLVPLLSCDGWDITTVEGVGNEQIGYHKIQERLATFGGTQCGYCSSGMVMNMYSLMESNRSSGLRMKQIENSFDGNICRCTGYHPILDAFKSFATDASPHLLKLCANQGSDIEDLVPKVVPNTPQFAGMTPTRSTLCSMQTTGEKWIKVSSLVEAFQVLQYFKGTRTRVRMVAGNTGSGVFKNDWKDFRIFLDIGNVKELKKVEVGPGNLVLGGGVTMAEAIEGFQKASRVPGFEYALQLGKHIGRVANVHVRNIGTLAGNLMVKRNHPDFPSDLFTIFETVGATLWIASSLLTLDVVTLSEFLRTDMKDKIIVSIYFPVYTSQPVFRSFKISRRFQSSHAYVNAGFLVTLGKHSLKVLEKPRIVFGGISPNFVHASTTEQSLVGKSLLEESVLNTALTTLSNEVHPEPHPSGEDGSANFRKLLCQSLFYKFVLGLAGQNSTTNQKYLSGGRNLERKLTSGKQIYDSDPTTWPINQPVIKLESFPQVSGAAEYVNDIQPRFGELYGAFVLSTVAKADIIAIDPTDAYNISGVVRFISAKDIPGTNNYMQFHPSPEEVFAASKVAYYGQAVGLILAETQTAALQGSEKVRVTYGNVEKGVFTLQEAIRRAKMDGSYSKLFGRIVKSSQVSSETPSHWMTGEFSVRGQYHFQMENQIAICHPREDGMDVYSATQWIELVQASVASALNLQNNEINVTVRRLGGAFGSNVSRATQIATACAVGAHLCHRPVRLGLDLATNMALIGKRYPVLMKYKVGVNSQGAILRLKASIFTDNGASLNEALVYSMIREMQSVYRAIGWELRGADVVTNTAPNTLCRSPTTASAIAFMENVIEHVALEMGLDPMVVRTRNMFMPGDALLPYGTGPSDPIEQANLISELLPRMLKEVQETGNMRERQEFMKTFNQNNRWRKRGMALVPMHFPVYSTERQIPAYVAIYKNDATVVVSHGGIEMGQGINTKIAQAVALELNIPMSKIRVKPTMNYISPNSARTSLSVTNDLGCYAALQACKKLNSRMAPIREKFNPSTWEELVKLCHSNNIQLSASYLASPKDKLKEYGVWVVNLTEVEIDVLTGEHKIVRMDVIEDAGKSLNPALDVGQIQGAVVMGIGNWTTEKLLYDETTGKLLSDGTWLYNPPLPKNIPEDLRVTLLKNAPNPVGVLSSKSTGEPPVCSAVAVLFALKAAIHSARIDAGQGGWFPLNGPVTVEDVLVNCLTSVEQFKL